MEKSTEHKLEGLLKARSQDLRRPARRVRPRTVAAHEAPAHGGPLAVAARPTARGCEACADPIDPRRLRALPDASRCLGCQRAHELAAARS